MAESLQKWVGRNRPPRVQITYDVEIGGASRAVELPLVVGILSDLGGVTPNPLKLKDRRFIEIDRDNFGDVFKAIKPSVNLQLQAVGASEPSTQNIIFESMDDFKPDNLLAKVSGIQDLLKLRNLLSDLAAKLDGNTDLDAEVVALGTTGTANQKLLAGAYNPKVEESTDQKAGQ